MDMQTVNTNPSPQSPIKDEKNNAIAYILFALTVVLIIGVGVYLSSQISKIKKDQVGKTDAIEKRLAKLEAPVKYEQEQVDKSKIQAVFLENGQVYFGNITHIDQDTLTLEHIYYLKEGSFNKNQSISGSNISLVKLGSELHAPEDKMVIERKNAAFWENLKSDGQVAKAIAQYIKSNPSKD